MKEQFTAEQLRRGEKVAFDAFYECTFPLYLSFALRFLPEREVCRDLLQEVYIRYWKKHTEFSDMISIKVFFYRSLRNGCLNYLEHARVHQKYAAQQRMRVEDEGLFLDQIIREEVAYAIHRKIDRLSPMEQQVILLSMAGKSNDEMAEELSLSVNTIKTHKARAYATLRRQLQDLKNLLIILGGL